MQPTRPVSLLAQVIGSVLLLAALIAAGVTLGVVLTRNHNSSTTSSSTAKSGSSTGSSSSDGADGVVSQKDPNDPSTFTKNADLKHSFYGLAYTPEGSQLPACGNSLGKLSPCRACFSSSSNQLA